MSLYSERHRKSSHAPTSSVPHWWTKTPTGSGSDDRKHPTEGRENTQRREKGRWAELTWKREGGASLLVLVVFIFFELRDETKLRTTTALRKIGQSPLKMKDRESGPETGSQSDELIKC